MCIWKCDTDFGSNTKLAFHLEFGSMKLRPMADDRQS